MENQTGLKIKRFRYDNSRGEYTNNDFKRFLKDQGISNKPAPQYQHWMNGVVERKISTIEDFARCMLQQVQLPGWFWPEAINIAVYILNCCPTKAVAEKTPYEAYTGRKPNLSHLRIFSCIVYMHLHRQQRGPGNFISRAHQCILLGHVESSTSIHKLFDVEKGTIFNSGSIVFDEQIFPGYAQRHTTKQAARTAEKPDNRVYDTIHIRVRGALALERMHAESNEGTVDR